MMAIRPNLRFCHIMIAASMIMLGSGLNAAIDAYPFPNDEMRQRYHALIDELRCPQCLNTNLAGSDSMISRDLRREVHSLVLDGRSDAEILEFMYDRYGDFILYNPQLKPGTLLLWFGPLGLFLIAAYVVFRFARRSSATGANLSDDEQRQLDQLIASVHPEK